MRTAGFSLTETVVAMALTLTIAAGVFSLLQPAIGVFAAEPAVAELQQRQRVAADALGRDLSSAGAGPFLGDRTGSLIRFFAPVLPYRLAPIAHDPAGTARTDIATIISVPATAAQTTLAADLLPGVLTVQADPEPWCPAGQRLCGFAAGMMVAIFDSAGSVDLFSVSAVIDGAGQIVLNARAAYSPVAYRTGSTIVEVRVDVYSLKSSAASQTFQLMHSDGSADVPAVDHVVGLTFEYDGEAQPPAIVGEESSYGQAPPPVGQQTSAYPAGENCFFQRDPISGAPVPRLAALAPGTGLVRLSSAQFVDGPWCPDVANANRWDADLIRIRRIWVTLRVEASTSALRGPAGVLFANGGSSPGANRWVPDREIRFPISPRNLNTRRP
jgi:hypothetical protein